MFNLLDGRDFLYQWDLNRALVCLNPAVTQVHFYYTKDQTLRVDLTEDEFGTYFKIPNILLQESGNIRFYGCDDKHTQFEGQLVVKKRPKPSDYVYTETEIYHIEEVINKSLEQAKESGEFDGITPRIGENGNWWLGEEDTGVKADGLLERIDITKTPNGDPLNPSLSYDLGTYAGLYSEYYGADKKWRTKLLRANSAAYASLDDKSVNKFIDNLLTSRIPVTDSAGRLSVASPQKGANGQYYYYNPDASAATNNTYNMAIPLWYGDERYVRASTYTTNKKATDKKIAEIEDKVANVGDGPKLYRHDIHIYTCYDNYASISLRGTLYATTSDPLIEYDCNFDWSEEAGTPPTANDLAFLANRLLVIPTSETYGTDMIFEEGGAFPFVPLAVCLSGNSLAFDCIDLTEQRTTTHEIELSYLDDLMITDTVMEV